MLIDRVNFNVAIIAPQAFINGVAQNSHTHSQANDSAGNTEQDVGAPKNP